MERIPRPPPRMLGLPALNKAHPLQEMQRHHLHAKHDTVVTKCPQHLVYPAAYSNDTRDTRDVSTLAVASVVVVHVMLWHRPKRSCVSAHACDAHVAQPPLKIGTLIHVSKHKSVGRPTVRPPATGWLWFACARAGPHLAVGRLNVVIDSGEHLLLLLLPPWCATGRHGISHTHHECLTALIHD